MKYKHAEFIVTGQKVLSDDEREKLIGLCNRSLEGPGMVYVHRAQAKRFDMPFLERRNALMILITLELGLRASELLSLTVKDFAVDRSSLFIKPLKGSRPRELPLHTRRANQLKTYVLAQFKKEMWSELDRERLLFPVCYKQYDRIWKKFRPSNSKNIHSLRHTFAVDFLMRSNNLKALQMALGHKSLRTTEVYQDFIYRQTYMRELMYGKQRTPTVRGSGSFVNIYS